MSYGTTFQVELHEPEITITSEMIRWAIIDKIKEENPDAHITHGWPLDHEYAVNVYFISRQEREEA